MLPMLEAAMDRLMLESVVGQMHTILQPLLGRLQAFVAAVMIGSRRQLMRPVSQEISHQILPPVKLQPPTPLRRQARHLLPTSQPVVLISSN